VLAGLALAPELELHVREVAQRGGLDAPGVMRELRLLERHGIYTKRRQHQETTMFHRATSPALLAERRHPLAG
jgi:hypothetical protein